jgi:hypothetical protein
LSLSEILLILLLAATLAGLGIILFVEPPQAGPDTDTLISSHSIGPLVACFEEVALGGAPRARVSGDTLVYTIDLDTRHYTAPQANLLITRALTDGDIRHLSTSALSADLLSFQLVDAHDRPVRIDVKH